MNSSSRRGRRVGSPDTRAQILAVARDRFRREGYDGVTMRSLAADVGVDAALISYYFGSKRGLFAAVMEISVHPADILDKLLEGDLESLPQRAIRTLIVAWDQPATGLPLLSAVRAAIVDPELAALLRRGLHHELIDQLADRIGGADARQRAGTFVGQIGGLLFIRYVLAVEPLASMTADEIVRTLGPALRVTLFGPVPAPGRHALPRA